MVDHCRWPGREPVEQLNWKYDQALKPSGKLVAVPASWWGDYQKEQILLGSVPHQEREIRRMIDGYGRRAFEGLDLKGFA
jgi:hypothetical protein